MRTFTLSLRTLLLVAASVTAWSQCGPSARPHVLGLSGCTVRCDCFWRVTVTENHTPLINTPYVNVPDRLLTRRQQCDQGAPELTIQCEDKAPGAATIPGATSTGSYVVHIEHVDPCIMCGGASGQVHAVMAGWSKPQYYFSGITRGAASYYASSRMQIAFSTLTGANNLLEVTESASSHGYGFTFQASLALLDLRAFLTPPSFSGRLVLTMPSLQVAAPSNQLRTAPWKQDQKPSTDETVVMLGHVNSSANADGSPFGSLATALALIQRAEFCAGVNFTCVCDPAQHGPSPNSGASPGLTATPDQRPGGPGGTTPRPAGRPLQPEGPVTAGSPGGRVTTNPGVFWPLGSENN